MTIRGVGISPRMVTATATAEVQAWLMMLRSEGVFANVASDASWRELADRIKIESKNLNRRRARHCGATISVFICSISHTAIEPGVGVRNRFTILSLGRSAPPPPPVLALEFAVAVTN